MRGGHDWNLCFGGVRESKDNDCTDPETGRQQGPHKIDTHTHHRQLATRAASDKLTRPHRQLPVLPCPPRPPRSGRSHSTLPCYPLPRAEPPTQPGTFPAARSRAMSVPGTLIRTHSANSNMGINDTRHRRRSRSTSIIHEVLPETVTDEIDQSALPNWNSSWVNFKGTKHLVSVLCGLTVRRSMADTSHHDHLAENTIQLLPGGVARVILDSDQSHLYGVLVLDVPLGQGDTV
jgi:hypothetical protein